MILIIICNHINHYYNHFSFRLAFLKRFLLKKKEGENGEKMSKND